MSNLVNRMQKEGIGALDIGSDNRTTIRMRLEQEKQSHANRLKQIDRALALLDKNPDIEELVNII